MNLSANPHRGSTFKSIAAKLRVSFTATSLLLCFIIAFFYWFDKRDTHLERIYAHLERINLKVEQASNLEKQFLLEETINPNFYKTGHSHYISEHKALLDEVKTDLQELKNVSELQNTHISSNIDTISNQLDQFTGTFDTLVDHLQQRGFKDYGYEGEMRGAIRGVMEADYPKDMVKLLSLRRHEKDYMLRKDKQYVEKLQKELTGLKEDISQRNYQPAIKAQLLQSLQTYESYFLKLVEADQQLGLSVNQGLSKSLSEISKDIEHRLIQTSNEVREKADISRKRLEWGIVILSAILILLNFLLSLFTTRSLSGPIEELSKGIHKVVESDFEEYTEVGFGRRKDEIGQLSQDFSYMLRKVREHTGALKKQQQQTSLALSNVAMLAKMGQQLASTLQIDEILDISFESLQKLMDVSIVWVGLYRKEHDGLTYYGVHEGKHLESFTQALTETKLGVWCFKNQEQVLIQDAEEAVEYKAFGSARGEKMQTIAYLPLTSGGKKIGVLGVQHQNANAFSEMDIDILKGFASYLVIALDNALIYESLELTIRERTAEVEAQKEYLEAYAKKMMASINYAKRIQEALLPNMEHLREALPHSFVLFQPRDMVSGDFFWFHEKNGKQVIAALDCTGHGVPGAFMSMIGNELLNEAIIRMELTDPAEILYHVHRGIRRDLRQYETGNRDGIDMSICVIDRKTKMLDYAGAKSPLAYVKGGEITMLKGDIYPVGGEQREKRRTFNAHQIPFEQETTFYLFSDGYQDQFGGPNGRKFMKRAFRELLLEISLEEMDTQKHRLEKRLSKWMGSKHSQIDDVLVIGFRL